MAIFFGILNIYYWPVMYYLTEYTDCFYFIEKPGEYSRRHPTTFILILPLFLIVFLFFEVKKQYILEKYVEFEAHHEELKKKNKAKTILFIIASILYLVITMSLILTQRIPAIHNCLDCLK